MKRSDDFYLKRLSGLVEAVREEKTVNFEAISEDTILGMRSVVEDYMYSLWLSIGDTAFNREGYRHATDLVIEQLRRHD